MKMLESYHCFVTQSRVHDSGNIESLSAVLRNLFFQSLRVCNGIVNAIYKALFVNVVKRESSHSSLMLVHGNDGRVRNWEMWTCHGHSSLKS